MSLEQSGPNPEDSEEHRYAWQLACRTVDNFFAPPDTVIGPSMAEKYGVFDNPRVKQALENHGRATLGLRELVFDALVNSLEAQVLAESRGAVTAEVEDHMGAIMSLDQELREAPTAEITDEGEPV